MRRRAFLLVGTATLATAGCRSFTVEAALKQPSELTATAVAQPNAVPAPLGRIAFIRGGDLWIKELPDGPEQRLTQDGRNDLPLWSPSGEWLAFRKDDQVWFVRSDGSSAAVVSKGTTMNGFAWSPVEDLLAYAGAGGTLRLVKPESPGEKELVSRQGVIVQGTGVNAFVWSPDGLWIAYEWLDSPTNVRQAVQELKRQEQSGGGSPFVQEIRRIRVDGSESKVVHINHDSERDFLAGWSPDEQWLLAWHGTNSGSVRSQGLPLEALALTGGGTVQLDTVMLTHQDFLSWSPDGQRLALVDGGRPETWENKSIDIVTLAPSLHRISDNSRADLFPAWSPDGRWIAFSGAPGAPGVGGAGPVARAMAQRKIWIMKPDGTGKRQLTNGSDFRDERPEWSANGDYILFARLRGDQAQLWLMRADGSDQRQVVDELTPSPGGKGYFGYVDWGQLYDWWPERSTAKPTPKPTGTSKAEATPSATTSPRATQGSITTPSLSAP